MQIRKRSQSGSSSTSTIRGPNQSEGEWTAFNPAEFSFTHKHINEQDKELQELRAAAFKRDQPVLKLDEKTAVTLRRSPDNEPVHFDEAILLEDEEIPFVEASSRKEKGSPQRKTATMNPIPHDKSLETKPVKQKVYTRKVTTKLRFSMRG
jgi:hypothetical protein